MKYQIYANVAEVENGTFCRRERLVNEKSQKDVKISAPISTVVLTFNF